MPVTEQTPINSSTGNGVTTVFPYTFLILDEADIAVYVDDVLQTLTTDYTVSGVDNPSGGNVTFVSAPGSGTTVVRRREMAYARTTDYQENGDLEAATLDADLDAMVMLAQQLNAEFVRALKLPKGTTTNQELSGTAADRANKYLAFDSSGNLTMTSSVDPGTLTVSAFMETVLDDLDAASARATLGLAAGSDIASAATLDITAATGNLVRITGTTTTTNVTINSGQRMICYAVGAWPLTHHATNLPLPGSADYTCAAGDSIIISKDGNGDKHVEIVPNAVMASAKQLQAQTYQRFTTGGSSTAYTLTPTPATTTNAAGQRFRVAFHTAAGTTPTLAVSGQTALNLKYNHSTGTKQAVTSTQIPSGWVADVECDGTDWVVLDIPSSAAGWTLVSPTATTSGTSVDLTGIPSAKVIHVMLSGVSTNGTSAYLLQLGDSGGVETTGYNGVSSAFNGTLHALNTDGFRLHGAPAAAGAYDALLVLSKQDNSDNTWVASWFCNNRNSAYEFKGVGQKSLSAELDRIRLTTVGGTDTFDAGEISISYSN